MDHKTDPPLPFLGLFFGSPLLRLYMGDLFPGRSPPDMEEPDGIQGAKEVAVFGELGWRPKETIGLQSQQTAAALEVPNLEGVASGTACDHSSAIWREAESFGSIVMSS